MTVILIELAIIAVAAIVLRALRSKIRFFRGGYTVTKDSYQQDAKIKMLVEDTHFRRGAVRNNRRLRVDGSNLTYSMIPLDKENKALLVYSYCAPLLAMVKGQGTPIKRALVLGGGGGAVPLYILQNYEKATVDTVEINADSIRISNEYFLADYAGEGGRSHMIQADARDAVKTLEAPYQFIFCDLYIGGAPADVVYEAGFMQDVSRLCGPDGMLVINGGSFTWQGAQVVMKNLLAAFGSAWLMLTGDGFILAAANRPMPAMDALLQGGSGIIPMYPSQFTPEAIEKGPGPQQQ